VKSDEIDFVAEIARQGAGLLVDPEKEYLLESRLAPVARREGFGSIREMLVAARQRREEKLLWAVVEALAQGETSFFRDPEVFARIRCEMLPERASGRPSGLPIRIWSAGCGAGQEAYSLAFTVEDCGPEVAAAGVEIMGADVSERALEKAQTGLYTQFEVQRGLPIRVLARHFEPSDELWALSARVRAMVRWRRLNLNAELRGLPRFDIVLCRYVLEAMTPAARRRVLEQLAGALAPGGYLVLGSGETTNDLAGVFTPLEDGVHRLSSDFRAAA
jgi:chemotaxis protein methyltransferase CheR